MPILNINTNIVGQVGTIPRIIQINTNDNIATITAVGYLNAAVKAGLAISTQDMALVYGSDVADGNPGSAFFQVLISGGNTTLNPAVESGSVVLPTIANHIATYLNIGGKITEDAATAINGGNIQAGLSGTAGTFASFPATANKGSLKLTAVANTGDTVTTISNVAAGQASVVSIPDPGGATGLFILANTASSTQNIATDVNITGNHNITTNGGGFISAGVSGFAGALKTYPATAATGHLEIQGVANASSNTATTISNASFAQASTVSFADVGSAAGRFLVANTATPFTTAHVPAASGTGGLMIDSGIAYTALATSTISSPDAGSNLIWKDVSCTFTALASGAHVVVQLSSGSKQYVVRDIKVNYGAAGLSGGGGDRLLVITDGTFVFNSAGITAALLGTPVNTVYGGSGNPLSAIAVDTPSTAGQTIYAAYSGGTNDYTAGSVVISVLVQRVA